jgi:DNA ligase-1
VLRQWLAAEANLPEWLVDEGYEAVGDLSEALALLLPDGPGTAEPLHRIVESRLVPLRDVPLERRREILVETWRELDGRQRLVWNKIMMGSFRVGVARTLVIRALATVADVSPAVMAHRLMGQWQPTEGDFQRLMKGSQDYPDPGQPYPFYLAYPLDQPVESLGPIDEWQVEWKWDGIRAQLIRRGDDLLIWSRGEELITDRFPEIIRAGRWLPPETVLDGELLPWSKDRPMPFAALQRRIGRKTPDAALQRTIPVVFMAYDLLEFAGQDVRARPLAERRAELARVVATVNPGIVLLSSTIAAASWEEVLSYHARAHERAAEGLMLKRCASSYGVGRRRGDWWKWKVDPFSIDAVLLYAQQGNGRRASLFTDYTFGIWQDQELVPIAKAYSGLTDAEIKEVDSFIRQNTIERHGPVRVVRPERVFELAFEGVQISSRHKSGLAVRFPRIARWRRDKTPQEADTLETLRAMLPKNEKAEGATVSTMF